MSIKSQRVLFSPDVNDKPINVLKHSDGGRIFLRNKYKKSDIGTPPKLSPVKFLIGLGTRVASAIRGVSMTRRSSRKVSSSSTLVRSRSISDLTDPHRAETVEDCIEFLHSSSSRERPSFS